MWKSLGNICNWNDKGGLKDEPMSRKFKRCIRSSHQRRKNPTNQRTPDPNGQIPIPCKREAGFNKLSKRCEK